MLSEIKAALGKVQFTFRGRKAGFDSLANRESFTSRMRVLSPGFGGFVALKGILLN